MSDCVDTLLVELLDLARGQRVALADGRLDDAVSFLGVRGSITDRIRSVGTLTEDQKDAASAILSIDAEIEAAARSRMADVAARLDGVEKVRSYLGSVSSADE